MSDFGKAKNEIESEEIGVISRGSLSEGLEMRLAEGKSVEDLRVGKFMVIRGDRNRYFAMLNDVQLSASHSGFLLAPPRKEDVLAQAVLRGVNTFGIAKLRPMLMIPNDAASESQDELLPIKTIPAHFSPVCEANSDDVARVFGREDSPHGSFFHVGEPLDMDTPVCLNLKRWVERSNAIFGKSGTGKTFLTRLCHCGVIKANNAVNLIFDMHSEYGWQGTQEGVGSRTTKGLKQHFGSRVKIFTLDEAHAHRMHSSHDYVVRIPYSQITAEDVGLLQKELNLPATTPDTCHSLINEWGENWLENFLALDNAGLKEYGENRNVNHGGMAALQRRLSRLAKDCETFLVPTTSKQDNAVNSILRELQSGYHVVLEFGGFDRPIQYMLVVNILTRLIHEKYREMTEIAIGSNGTQPKPLVITIEEAHKFLTPQLAEQTIFGTIAREMRKYNVTLLIVDQRPSQIDDEILSQVGTKICCLLDDEKDINAVLTGVHGANSLRNVLASLETRQQALIFGHAVPMPVVVKTRNYDEDFFRTLVSPEKRSEEKIVRDFDDDYP